MGIASRLKLWLRWSADPSPKRSDDWYRQWHANLDEAHAIARYFRYMAERRGDGGGARGQARHGRA
jgi:hypothetical protein